MREIRTVQAKETKNISETYTDRKTGIVVKVAFSAGNQASGAMQTGDKIFNHSPIITILLPTRLSAPVLTPQSRQTAVAV